MQSIFYFANLHDKWKVFHGDIKPENIFVQKGLDGLFTDSGTLIDITDPAKTYKVIYATAGYCSIEHGEDVKNRIPRTVEQLLKEDRHQLIKTFETRFKKIDITETTQTLLHILRDLSSSIYEASLLI